jgi:hypothetical protein
MLDFLVNGKWYLLPPGFEFISGYKIGGSSCAPNQVQVDLEYNALFLIRFSNWEIVW